MYKEILKEQLEKLQNWQRKTAFTSDELIRFSTMIQETARKLQAVEDAETIPLEQPQKIKITLDGTEIAEALKAVLNPEDIEGDEEFWEIPSKEEILEDFSNAELIQELEKRGVLKTSELTPDITLLTGSIYHAD